MSSESAEKLVRQWRERDEKVRKSDYVNWICDFIENTKCDGFDDESIAYDEKISVEDKKNVTLLSWFISYVQDLAQVQRVLNVPNPENEFENVNYDIEMKGGFYNVSSMAGQGSIHFISKLDEKPNHCFVKIL